MHIDKILKKNGLLVFRIQFHSFRDAAAVVFAGTQKKVFIGNKAAWVTMDHSRVYSRPGEFAQAWSRMMVIQGPANAFKDISPDSIREALRADPEAMSAAEGYGVESEPVATQSTVYEKGEGVTRSKWALENLPTNPGRP